MSTNLSSFEETIGFWAYRMQAESTAVLRRCFQTAGYDLTPEQWAVLARLKEQQGMNQSQLGEKLLKDRHNMTRILNVLEKRGYIERRGDSTDKRVYRIFLTPEGKTIQDEMGSVVVSHRARMLDGLGREELSTARDILKQIVKNLEEKGK
jgi:DNA-binding MarR family transcriptional regulator